MDTRHLRAVIAVAGHGSFTRAAQDLFMVQSTLSRQVAALEKELGVVLFVRGPRAATLTAHGEVFLPSAQEVLDAESRAMAAVRDPKGAARNPCDSA